MTTKYTPGPWTVANESYCPQTDRSGYRIESLTAGGIVCDVIHTGHFGAENPEANADLIAAAPELALALQNALQTLQAIASEEGDTAYWNDGGDGREACNIARQALAKAGLLS